MQMYASARVEGYAMILARHVALGQGPTSMRLIDQASSMYDMKIKSWEGGFCMQCTSERLWKSLLGRYSGCFEERYKEAYDDRPYHAKGLDAPAKYAPTVEVRKGNARYQRG